MGILEKYQYEITVTTSNPSIEDGWEPAEEEPGYFKKCVTHEHGTATIYRPILTDEERAKREKEISRAYTNLVNSSLREIDKKLSAKEYDKADYEEREDLTEEELKLRVKELEELEKQLDEAVDNYVKQMLDPKTWLK